MVQQGRSSGGAEQARAIRRASATPEDALAAGAVLLLSAQGGLQALLDETLVDALDGGSADLDGLGNLGIGPGGAALGAVGLE